MPLAFLPDFVDERAETMKANIRANGEHPFRVLSRQFGFTRALPRPGQRTLRGSPHPFRRITGGRARDPEMHQTKKDKQWFFETKAHAW